MNQISDAQHINFRGVSIYRIQNGKMIETWHVIDGLPYFLVKCCEQAVQTYDGRPISSINNETF